jgi:hypothetical protein
MHGVRAREPAVYVLDVDPDLAQGIPETEQREARQRSIARVLALEQNRWDLSELAHPPASDWLGLLVIDGLLVRRVKVAGRAACELFGAGDVLRPWDVDGDYDPLAVTVDWLVIQPADVAVLDRAFARRIARWPTISAELTRRIAARARHLSLIAAITHIPRTHARLLLLFWLLSERWGAVTPEGILIRLPLTHHVLAMLVGSHRPTVTVALQRLARDGLLIRRAHNRWLLATRAIDALRQSP